MIVFSIIFAGSFSKLTAKFNLNRKQGYYIWNIYVPASLLVVMTWVTFWLPPSAYPARVAVCVTSFLSSLLVMNNAGKKLSQISYLKAIDSFLIGNATFVFLSLVQYVFVLEIFKKGLSDEKEKVRCPKRGLLC